MLALITKGILFDRLVSAITNNYILPLNVKIKNMKNINVDVTNKLMVKVNVRPILN